MMHRTDLAQDLRVLNSSALSLAAVLLASLCGPTAHAAIGYSAQARSVNVSGTAFETVQAAAPDFALFSRTVSFTDPLEGHGGQAMQRSELLTDRIVVSSRLSALDGRSGFLAAAASRLDVSFSLDEPTTANLTGNWIMSAALAGGVTLTGEARLSRQGVPIWIVPITSQTPTAATVPFGAAGELPAGNYRLEVTASLQANVIPGFTNGSADITAGLFIPAPAVATLATVAVVWPSRRRTRGRSVR